MEMSRFFDRRTTFRHHHPADHVKAEIERLRGTLHHRRPRTLVTIGHLWEHLGDAPRASEAYRAAAALNRDIGGPRWRELQVSSRLAHLRGETLEPTLSFERDGVRLRYAGEACVIGRASRSTDICVPASMVAYEHCALWREGGRWFVCDLGSTNGTFLDGEPVETAPMSLERSTVDLVLADVGVRVTLGDDERVRRPRGGGSPPSPRR